MMNELLFRCVIGLLWGAFFFWACLDLYWAEYHILSGISLVSSALGFRGFFVAGKILLSFKFKP